MSRGTTPRSSPRSPAAVGVLVVAATVVVGWTIPALDVLTTWGGPSSSPPWTAVMASTLASAMLTSGRTRRRLAVAAALLALLSLGATGPIVDLQLAVWPGARAGTAPGIDLATLLLAVAAWTSGVGGVGGLPTAVAAGAAAIANLSLFGVVLGADWLAAAGAGGPGGAALPSVSMLLLLALAVVLADTREPAPDLTGASTRAWVPGLASAVAVPAIAVWLLPRTETPTETAYATTALLVVAIAMATQLVVLAIGQRDALSTIETMLDASPEATLFVDTEGTIVRVNAAVADTFGWPRQLLAGRPIEELVPIDERGRHATRRRAYLLRPQGRAMGSPEGRVVAQRRDGSTFPAEVALAPLRIRGRTLVAATVRDVTAHEQQVALLQRLHEMQAMFLAAVSHELRTPLTVVLGITDTLVRHDQDIDGARRQDMLRRLAANARRLDALLGDLLDLERLRRGVGRGTTRLDAGPLVTAQVRESAHDLRLDVTLEVAPDLPPVQTDAVLLPRVVDNLLSNAAKYAPGPVEVRVRAADDGIVILVDDHGPGVPAAMRNQVFEPFRRGDRIDTATPGVGIGLALVAGVAHAAQGRAWVQDRDDGQHGASFRLFLPAAQDDERIARPGLVDPGPRRDEEPAPSRTAPS